MPKYTIIGYYVTPWSATVEAENADEAESIGEDIIIYQGNGVEGEGEWQPEFDVEEEE